ncbi:site-specific integrase [Roseomonas sp. NAR14]|uniref:Site-specific integrase n=1 Tax=Roseomonas acroporae TaxID=2937791 RepID=A0A9X1YBZ8_9PROT|nr:site-specific integrase [Roseomonas acroporae]MCK8787326.1 site-specific integrase [Roseomonas acroporae]
MPLPMPRPFKRPKSGTYMARLAVPVALRAVVGRVELRRSLNTKDPKEAKRLHPAAMAELQAELDRARLQASGAVVSVPDDRLAALAGDYYRRLARDVDAAPGSMEAADVDLDLVLGELSWVIESDEDESLPGREFIPSERQLEQARQHLLTEGILGDADSIRRMAGHLWTLRYRLARRRLQRAEQNFGPDPEEARYPPPQAPASPAVTMTALLEAHQQERQEQPKTFDKRQSALAHLRAAAGHDDAHKVDKAAVRDMKAARLAKGVKPATVAADFAMLRSLWNWGASNGYLPEGRANPFTGMSPRGAKKHTSEREPFTDDEAARILTAARSERGFLRWLPWVLAFTGCRLEEATGALRADIRQVRGVWVLDIHDRTEGRTLKDGQPVRLVPLHPALTEEGFLRYVEGLPKGGPLFPDLTPGRFGKRSEMATKKLRRWLKGKVGIDQKGKVAGHSWRHRMKDTLRFAGVPAEAADAILGHSNPMNAGGGYGAGWRGRPDELAKELVKVVSPLPPRGGAGP